jgi:nitroreductase
MDLEQAIYARRAVREYTDEPIPTAILRQLIDAAIQAPSAVNEQSWSFTVVEDRRLLRRISTESKAYMLRQPLPASHSSHFRELLEKPDFDIFYHAPALVLISSPIQDRWAVENCSLAAENPMLAACGLGLGTCWIGFAQTWLGTPEGKTALGLPATYLPVAPIIVGRPRSPALPVPRKEPEIHWIEA